MQQKKKSTRPPKPQSLEDLKKVWYKKLKDTGFEDIEDTNSPKEFLRRWDSHWFRTRGTPNWFEAKTKYFDAAYKFLHSHNFDSALERAIWAGHADGLSQRAISEKLRIKKKLVSDIVNRLRNDYFGR